MLPETTKFLFCSVHNFTHNRVETFLLNCIQISKKYNTIELKATIARHIEVEGKVFRDFSVKLVRSFSKSAFINRLFWNFKRLFLLET